MEWELSRQPAECARVFTRGVERGWSFFEI
jgi:hypothetical protein